MDKQIYLVYIIVLRGQKRDTSDERHAGILFAPLESGLYYYFHLADGTDGYAFEMKTGLDPRQTSRALPTVRVGRTLPLTEARLVELMRSAPVGSKDDEFTHQHWIYGALGVLAKAGFVSQQACDKGFNKMLSTLLDGSADEVPDLDWDTYIGTEGERRGGRSLLEHNPKLKEDDGAVLNSPLTDPGAQENEPSSLPPNGREREGGKGGKEAKHTRGLMVILVRVLYSLSLALSRPFNVGSTKPAHLCHPELSTCKCSRPYQARRWGDTGPSHSPELYGATAAAAAPSHARAGGGRGDGGDGDPCRRSSSLCG
ncbi:hypothetical protein Purlil1_7225 [Purpureocillium lilacinum]|uniref:Uncharacterized protein n=3 Tax=Purpureocillium lilacinum TaxID=33203 RepID=A0ABR0BWA8_PURLI|nr:hypothetical protein Purlil1_7225 [Purpureocillium lilacinum]